MKLFLTFSKKSLAVLLAAAVMGAVLLGQLLSIRSGGADGSTNALRVAYLQGLGYNIDDAAVTHKDVVIPEEFSDVYEKYNRLQRQAGFDLAPYRGKQAEVYTYRLSNDAENEIHLMVSDGVVIGGDVCSLRIDGEMLPLCVQAGGKGTEYESSKTG